MNHKVISKLVAGTLLFSMVGYTLPVFAYTKEETVYTKLDSKGNDYKTVVSTHIINDENLDMIGDLSDLLNIKNTSGEETFKQDGSKITWNANKNDIYYQGESSKELPIECNIKYELDGKEISPEEIVGKSGKVKMTLQYTNKEARTVNINGKNVKMYVPFVVVAGTIVKNENASNITVSSGKVIDDGTKTIVAGMAMPGLQESLGVSKDEIEIPSNIEITMDTTDFKSESIVSYVTPKVLDENDLKVFDNLSQMEAQVDTLQSSSHKIEGGANTLKSGIGTAYQGAKTIQAEVSKATKTLSTDKSDALDSNTLAQIQTSAVSQVSTQIATQKAGIAASAKAQAEAVADSQKTATESAAVSSINAFLSQPANATYKAIYDNMDANERALFETAIKATASGTAKTTAGTTAKTTAEGITDQVATQVASSVSTTIASTVANQVKSAATRQVASQMNTLNAGLNQLTEGLAQLDSGAAELTQGIKTLNEQGIDKICNYIKGDVKDLTVRTQKLTELSKEYNNFTMLNGENNGNVKFIMIIDAIKKQEESEQGKEEVILEEDE